jgi:NTE family protein
MIHSSKQPGVAVVLGGGGLKPYAALPLFEFLVQQRIPVDLYVGCSGGSIVVSLLSAGYTPEQIQHEIVPNVSKSLFKVNWRAVLSLVKMPFGRFDRESAFVKKNPIRNFLHKYFTDLTFNDLQVKTILQATDFSTGEGVALQSGLVADAVYASSAMYPLLPPLKIGERWLLDGAYSAPVPVLQAVKEKASMIIVVDFLEELQENPKGFFNALLHTGRLNAKTITSFQTALSIDLTDAELICIKIGFPSYITFWEVDKIDSILTAGKSALEKVKDEILLTYSQKIGR